MARMKKSKKYYFSVEGETEQWYLKWLEDKINSSEAASSKVSFKCDVQKDPVKFVKKLTVLGKTDVVHLSDYESDEDIHVKGFYNTMDRMKQASKEKQIKYKFGYINLTFDLWIVLHKMSSNGHKDHRKHYITEINRAYDETFENMDQYKHKNNFERCLSKLELENVVEAISRAKNIRKKNEDNGYTLHNYKGYRFYKENPALEIWCSIEAILKDCNLIQ